MKFVLDASVAVAAARANEPSHPASRARVQRLLTGSDTILVPALFLVEVSSALARRGESPNAIRNYVTALTRPPHQVVTIGPRRAQRAMRLAMAAKLRGADALYVWLAASRDCPLVTLDAEVVDRAAAHCRIEPP